MASDIELLKVEAETLWVRNAEGRLVKTREPNGTPAPHLVIATTGEAQFVAIGSQVPEAVSTALEAAVATAAPSDPAAAPAALARCERLIADAVGSVQISSGPSYVIPPKTTFESSAQIHRSDAIESATIERLRGCDSSQTNWPIDEWRALLAGALGPWAVATIDGEVAAICHSARLASLGAEAGVWTHSKFRSHGHASAVTAAWASILAQSGRVLFYSTSAANGSSQRVAARLRLRPIGWIWQISSPRD